jgi:hypothetical protein
VTQLLISPQEYETLLKALKERIRSAQLQALRSVNSELISLYADIGRMIVEKQQGDTWGKSVVGNLADDLRKEFPGTNGFSAANLWRMKNFYEVYGRMQNSHSLCEKLAGLTTSPFWRSARASRRVSSTSVPNRPRTSSADIPCAASPNQTASGGCC